MSEKPNILIVDDIPENLFLLEKILQKVDANLIRAASGNEALTKTLHDDFALILLDVQMPEMSGYEAARYLREEEKTKNIPIIFVTAIGHDEKREIEGYTSGAIDYIFKPVNPAVLREKVKAFIKLYNNQVLQQQLILDLKDSNEKMKQLQSQLIQSEKMSSIGQLAAGVAHEINNPIGFVGSNINTLSEYITDMKELLTAYDPAMELLKSFNENSQCQELYNKITEIKNTIDLKFLLSDVDKLIEESNDGIGRVRKIVNDLKDFSHIDQAEVKEFDLNAGIESTINIIWHELKYKTSLKKDYGDIPKIKCHPQQLNQVFMNLLVNSAQSIKKDGDITIKTCEIIWQEIEKKQNEGFFILPVDSRDKRTANEKFVEINISDNGSGIDKKKMAKIFDPFFTTKEIGNGTGLGLSVSFGIIKRHNGYIGVKSEIGKGTVFVVCLPIL